MLQNNLPDYYPSMYLDGYEPWQIMQAAHTTMIKQWKERAAAKESAKKEAELNAKLERLSELEQQVNIKAEIKVKK
jgi:starvation-inducible outer membrane lipoprotein